MRTEIRGVAVASLVFVYLFFYEYLPPVARVHVPYDMQGYHYPLLDYAFRAVSHGRLPEWDPSIYCGLSFAGNMQAALFYPPNWALFAVNLGRHHLSYKSLEALVFGHLWIAFLLAYVWLRGRGLGRLASTLGSGVFAFNGYMLSQMNHVGVVTGCVWAPLGLWGIDQAARSGEWRPLWKVVAASALCFLAGYPATWVVMAVCFAAYAAGGPRRWRTLAGTVGAVAGSLLVVMVQLVPAWEAAGLKTYDPKYGWGIQDPVFYVSYLIPNYYDFGRSPLGPGDPPAVYVYLGTGALFGMAALIRRDWRNWREAGPGLTLGLASLIVLTDPYHLLGSWVGKSRLLVQVCKSFNFLEGLPLAAALLAAMGLDGFLRGEGRRLPRWLGPVAMGLLAAWSARLLWRWRLGGSGFASGWQAVLEPVVMLALFSLGLYCLRGESGPRRAWLAAAVVLAVGVEYKVFGTSRAFNSEPRDADTWYADPQFVGLDDAVYRQVREHPDSRVAVGETGPGPTGLRHQGLTTPQGFDPFLPEQYRVFVEQEGSPFRSDRVFDIRPSDERLMQLVGVRYFLVIENSVFYPVLQSNPDFRLLQPSQSFFKTYEYLRARPGYYWEEAETGSIERRVWEPETREFLVRSARGGKFVLAEQWFPGWRASVDGREVAIERWRGALQAVEVAPGEHVVRFRFRSVGLRVGAVVSVVALMVQFLMVWRNPFQVGRGGDG